MQKKPMIFLGSLLVLTLVVIFGLELVKGKVITAPQSTRVTEPKSTAAIPQHVIYQMMFRHVVWLQNKAQEEQAQGRDGSIYKNRYQAFANLSDKEAALLNQTATDTIKRVKEIEAQAEVLIKEFRGLAQAGKASSPPEELNRLESLRADAVTSGYIRLRDGFAPWRFSEFERFVDKNIKSEMSTTADGSLLRRGIKGQSNLLKEEK
jgi:hypothetical protein